MTIKSARQSAGLTQKQLADKTGINVRQIQKVEAGDIKLSNLTAGNFIALCQALDLNPNMIGGKTMKKLKMKDIFSRDAYEVLTAEERRRQLKIEQASEYSGWRRYPTTCSKLRERIPDEYWDKYSAKEIGDFMRLLKKAYDDGKSNRSDD